MAQLALYRKYRSQTFSDLIGQHHVVRTLQNGIDSGRIAHSYLFVGPRGTGKTSTARLLAKALCCEHGPTVEPDNTCEICRSITEGSCVDVIEMDAASESGVDEVREQIVEVVHYVPMVCRYKVFIIDEVHDLSAKAFDALLKTIEEPPPHIIFILATTEYNKVPPTIRSRCQKFEFHRASMKDLVERLSYVADQENVQIDPAALTAIARMADGGFRDALTLLEQAMLTTSETVTLEHVYDQLGLVGEQVVDDLLLAIKSGDVPAIMDLLAAVTQMGRDPRAILESMMYRMSDLTRASYQVPIGAQDATSEAAMHEIATRIGRDTLLRLRGEVAEAHKVIRDISLPRLWLESELVRMAAAPAMPMPVERPQAVRKTEPPARKPEEPKPAKPTEEPKSAAKKREQDGSKSAEDPDSAESVWSAVIASLPEGPPITIKARQFTAVSLDGNELIVSVPREMDLEWFTDKRERLAHLTKLAKEVSSRDYVVRLQLERKVVGPAQHVAVELPAEGQRLEQLAKDVFGV